MPYTSEANPDRPAQALAPMVAAPMEMPVRLPERLLVVAGSGVLARRRAQALVDAGIAVRVAATPDAVASVLATFAPQAVLAWLSAARHDALPANLLHLRQEAHSAGVPLVLALTDDDFARPDLVELATLADDVVVGGPDVRELALRLAAWSNRKAVAAPEGVLVAGRVSLDLIGHKVLVNGRDVALTHKEFELVRFLVMHRGRVMSREMILGEVWGHDFYGGLRTVDVHIRRIRSKLEEDGVRCIETVRNVGYKFVEEERP